MRDLPSVSRSKLEDNPLVPISGERLRAAIEFRNSSVRRTAKKAGERQQTVDFIVQGRSERCRRKRRLRLAKALDISAEWLGGEAVPPVAGAVSGLPLPEWRGEGGGVLDENLRRLDPGSPSLPPSYQLVWSELVGRVVSAWKRDIAKGHEEAARLAERYPLELTDSAWPSVAILVRRALALTWWRPLLIMPLPPPIAPANLAELDSAERMKLAEENAKALAIGQLTPKELDDFAKAGAVALSQLLRPWLDGERELDYDVAAGILDWLRSGGGPGRLNAMVRKAWNRDDFNPPSPL